MEIESGGKIARRVAALEPFLAIRAFFFPTHQLRALISGSRISSGEVHAPSRVTFAGYNVNPRQSYLERYKEEKRRRGEGREGKEEGKRE